MSENVTHAVFEVSLWSLVLSALEFFPLKEENHSVGCVERTCGMVGTWKNATKILVILTYSILFQFNISDL